MLGIFGIFGRSQDVQRFERALRAAGLHPRAVSDAIKLTVLKQLKEAGGADERACGEAAELIAYCILGQQGFAESHDEARIGQVEARIEAAIAAGRGLDARLVLLTLHAGVTQRGVVERYGLASE